MSQPNEKLPTIPKEWNLTEQQRASMIAAQQKVIEANNKIRSNQQNQLNMFSQHSSMNPPQYPIMVVVKENNNFSKQYYKVNKNALYARQYLLMDNNQNFIYANSFQDATSKVKNELSNPTSQIQKQYAKDADSNNKLRLSSDSIKSSPKISNFSLIPNSKYSYWEIITTNAASSMLSNLRMSYRNKGQGGTKRINSKNKSRKYKSKSTKKSKSRKSKLRKY